MSSISTFASRKTASAGRDQRRQLGAQGGVGQLVLVEVEDVEERLGGQQVQLAQRPAVEPGGEDGLPAVEHLLRLAHGLELGHDVLLDPRLLLQPRDGLLDRLQVGEDQLGVDGLHVVLRRDAPVDVHDVVVLEDPDDLADGVAVADVREELVAQPLALAGALDDAGDVDEVDRRGDELREPKTSASFGSRASGTPTTPTFGSIVANG